MKYNEIIDEMGEQSVQITVVAVLAMYACRQGFNPNDWKDVMSWIIDKPHELMVMVKTAEAIESTPMEIPAEVDEEIKKMNALRQALGQGRKIASRFNSGRI